MARGLNVRMSAKKITALLIFLLVQCGYLAAGTRLPNGSIIYGVVPTLFGAPPLQAVTEKMGEIHALGVDAIWLSPVYETDDPSHISYAVTNYKGLREDFGTPDQLHQLIKTAHGFEMKVILDFVPNHTSSAHPFYQDVQKNGRSSPYYDYYEWDENGHARFLFDWEELKNLNCADPKVRAFMADALEYWVTTYDIDGFRMDAAWAISERSPDFFPQLIQRLRTIKPDLVFIAEGPAHDPAFAEAGFDLAYDWGSKIGKWSWQNVFQNPATAGLRLRKILSRPHGLDPGTLRFINNNDTGSRFADRFGIAMTRLAATLELTLPGAALIYSGDENAASYSPYEDPPPIAWEDPAHLRPFYLTLAKLRKSQPALQGGRCMILNTSTDDVLAYLRVSENEPSVLVVLNFGPEKQQIDIRYPADFPTPSFAGATKNSLTGECVSILATPTGSDPGFRLEVEGQKSYVFIEKASEE